MSEPQHTHASLEPSVDDGSSARVAVKAGFPRTGRVDGAWWPRSRDLRAELPHLVAAMHALLGSRIGPVLRVGFAAKEWDPVGRERIATPTGRVKFAGSDVFQPDTVDVVTHSMALTPVVLVVIPPDTPAHSAADVMERAAAPDNRERPDELLGWRDDDPDRSAGHGPRAAATGGVLAPAGA